MEEKKEQALIIYTEDNGDVKKVYSIYEIKNGLITFFTSVNKITMPISRILKIKEGKNDE